MAAEACLEQGERRPQAHGFAALGTARLGGGLPGERVEMRPGRVLGDEAAKEQSGGDRPGERRIRRIGQIGDLALQHLVIAGPKAMRAAPVSVAKSSTSCGLSSAALVMASARTRRPSASVLSTSTVRPLREVRMSPGR